MDDLVFVHHPHQTEYVVPADAPIRLPAGLPPDDRRLRREPRDGGHGGARRPPAARRGGPRRRPGRRRPSDHDAPAAGRREADRDGRPARATACSVDRGRRGPRIGRGRRRRRAVSSSSPPGAAWTSPSRQAGARPLSRRASMPLPSPGPSSSRRGTGPARRPSGSGGAFHRRRMRVLSSQVSTLDPSLTPRWDRARRTALVVRAAARASALGADHAPIRVRRRGLRVRASRAVPRRVPAGGA